MWTHEIIFSVGDITSKDAYEDVISENFNSDYILRYTHVCAMLSRLNFEKQFLESKLTADPLPIGEKRRI